MDPTERRIAGEKLHTTLVHMAVEHHELYRVAHLHGKGLTEKEQMYLKKRISRFQELSEELVKLSNRVRHAR